MGNKFSRNNNINNDTITIFNGTNIDNRTIISRNANIPVPFNSSTMMDRFIPFSSILQREKINPPQLCRHKHISNNVLSINNQSDLEIEILDYQTNKKYKISDLIDNHEEIIKKYVFILLNKYMIKDLINIIICYL